MVRKSTFRIIILIFLITIAISACSGSTGLNATATTALNGRALLEQRCTKCHTLDRVESASKSSAGWGLNVREMVGKGAELNASEQEVLIDYLSITYSYP